MQWTRGPVIGRGSSATVHLATTPAGNLFAVKSTLLSSPTSLSSLQKEQNILSLLNHPNIISYIGHDITYNNNNKNKNNKNKNNNMAMYNLHMEYAPGGTIADMIKKQKKQSLDESLIRSYIYQILLGLDYMHENNVVHGDLKCENILLCENEVKIGDLGCARLVEKSGRNAGNKHKFSGTPVFMAPEVVRGEEQGFEADVWSVGCVVIEMATGCNPWPDVQDPISGLYRIGYSGEVPEFPGWLSPEGKDFLEGCLRRDARERYKVKELLGHPFVVRVEGLFERDSPTSVLDKDFWGSVETPESLVVTKSVEFCGESPVERIMRLVGFKHSCLPDWRNEDDWIMVR